MVSHEKPGTITIDEIRDQVINDIDIRPYYSPYKIYIIADADLMTPQAQNALLKTIEEPPEYAVILLLTNNIGGLLPTIQSRCVRLDLKVVDDGLVKKYLMEHLHVPDYQAEIDASFAQGSIGRAKEAATSQEFAEMTQNALRILKYANTMEVYELSDAIKSLSEDKQNINDYLDIFQFWFRDVLMFKATQEIDNLVFKQDINFIREQAKQRSYENLEKILDSIQKTKGQLMSLMIATVFTTLLLIMFVTLTYPAFRKEESVHKGKVWELLRSLPMPMALSATLRKWKAITTCPSDPNENCFIILIRRFEPWLWSVPKDPRDP